MGGRDKVPSWNRRREESRRFGSVGEVWFWGPHCLERLGNTPYGSFHWTRSHGCAKLGDRTISEPGGEGSGDGIVDVGAVVKAGSSAQEETERRPDGSMARGCLGGTSNNSLFDDLRSKFKVRAEVVDGRGVYKFQGSGWGYLELKYDRKSASDTSIIREASSAIVFRGPST